MASLPATRPIIGTNTDDLIHGSKHSDVMSGRAGDDTLTGQNGNDEVWGGSGDDSLHGNNGHDILYGSGGPSLVQVTGIQIKDDYPVSVVFEGETAGYRNTFGYYKIDEDGGIYDVEFIWENASLQGSGGSLIQGESREYLDVAPGETIAFFIISNGYNLNNQYRNINLETGTLAFLNSDGTQATINSKAPRLYHIAEDGTQTLVQINPYHTAAYGETVGLNPDSILHTTGVFKADKGTITLGFEDLYGGGDRDFDDSVFTVDIGTVNANVLNAHYRTQQKGETVNRGEGIDRPVVVTSDNDTLHGGTGSDELHGRSGHDLLFGDNGDDDLHGGSGSDTLDGGSGHDELFGNSGNDVLKGWMGNDELSGNSGDDTLHGERGEDTLYGGSGHDVLNGGEDNDLLNGGSGDDHLDGGYGSDVLKGGGGADTLTGGNGDDRLYGGHDDDTFLGDAGNDYFHGGKGLNTVDYSDFDDGVRLSLHNKTAHGTGLGRDSLFHIQRAITGDGDDLLKGSARDDILEAGGGNDDLRGLIGADTMTGGAGEDRFIWRKHDLNALDVITDFNFDEDVIDFTALGLAGDTLTSTGSQIIHQNGSYEINDAILLSQLDGSLILSVDLNKGSGDYTDVCELENAASFFTLEEPGFDWLHY